MTMNMTFTKYAYVTKDSDTHSIHHKGEQGVYLNNDKAVLPAHCSPGKMAQIVPVDLTCNAYILALYIDRGCYIVEPFRYNERLTMGFWKEYLNARLPILQSQVLNKEPITQFSAYKGSQLKITKVDNASDHRLFGKVTDKLVYFTRDKKPKHVVSPTAESKAFAEKEFNRITTQQAKASADKTLADIVKDKSSGNPYGALEKGGWDEYTETVIVQVPAGTDVKIAAPAGIKVNVEYI